ncbi:hypothetical protein [Methanolapillus millepedarum]|uniref:Uncharacterized protein n=1 Tax=Methanolapillus millepedarum TaxID=3028296 RepID=A0AA96VG44_9EURY|nr:hypothetical protein MsAc7_15240 [Methanosarcinaceae archaeon Ac7]
MAKRDAVKKEEQGKPEYVEAEQVAGKPDAPKTTSGKPEKTPEEKKRIYIENLIKTMSATIFGIVCGVICYVAFGTGEDVFWLLVLVPLLAVTYYIQRRLVFPVAKLDVSSISSKEWIGIQFLVLIFCLVTWTILLNASFL